jgi:hypothetical protein
MFKSVKYVCNTSIVFIEIQLEVFIHIVICVVWFSSVSYECILKHDGGGGEVHFMVTLENSLEQACENKWCLLQFSFLTYY